MGNAAHELTGTRVVLVFVCLAVEMPGIGLRERLRRRGYSIDYSGTIRLCH